MNVKNIVLLCAGVVALSAAACNQKPAPSSQTSAAPVAAPTPSAVPASALLAPEQANAVAPEAFKARFSTTKGDFVVEVHRSWAPHGADRFYNLVKIGYFEDIAFFRAIDGFMVQFGIHGSPAVNAKWHGANIPDDPSAGQSNHRGFITFATAGPNTRTTQLFINYGENGGLDGQGFTSFGQVVDGMTVVDSLYKGYGEGAPSGAGPDQGRIQNEGNAYLKASFPQLDYIKSAKLE